MTARRFNFARSSATSAWPRLGGVSIFMRNGNIRAQHAAGAERSKASATLLSWEPWGLFCDVWLRSTDCRGACAQSECRTAETRCFLSSHPSGLTYVLYGSRTGDCSHVCSRVAACRARVVRVRRRDGTPPLWVGLGSELLYLYTVRLCSRYTHAPGAWSTLSAKSKWAWHAGTIKIWQYHFSIPLSHTCPI